MSRNRLETSWANSQNRDTICSCPTLHGNCSNSSDSGNLGGRKSKKVPVRRLLGYTRSGDQWILASLARTCGDPSPDECASERTLACARLVFWVQIPPGPLFCERHSRRHSLQGEESGVRDDPLKGARTAAKVGINRANKVAVPCRDGKRFPRRTTRGTST